MNLFTELSLNLMPENVTEKLISSGTMEFPIIPASKRSISNRRVSFGIAINDADYLTKPLVNGVVLRCPYHQKWYSMISRCYSPLAQLDQPSYDGCSVTKEWLSFMNFRRWMKSQEWEGMHLDKDLLIPGNKVYSPESCMFVTHKINTLLNTISDPARKLPDGVNYHEPTGKYRAKISIDSKSVHLGLFVTPEQASNAYIKAKADHIIGIAEKQTEPLRSALINHADQLVKSQIERDGTSDDPYNPGKDLREWAEDHGEFDLLAEYREESNHE